MASDKRESPLLICFSCGKEAAIGQHLCQHCGAPQTPYAHTDPVLGVLSRGFAAQKATTEPNKLIVVIGTWMWMLPLAIGGIWLTVAGIVAFVEELTRDSSRPRYGLGIPVLLFAALGATLLWIAITITFKTTRGYLKDLKSVGDSTKNEEAEAVECLECGEPFSTDADSCPKCGWTYS